MRYTTRSALCLAALAGLATLIPFRADARIVDLISSPPDPYALGTSGNERSERYGTGGFSDDERWLVFDSEADNLVAGDENHFSDVFLLDRQTGAVTLVSRAAGGAQGNAESYASAISGNGRYVAFASFASNLVAGDTNGGADAFVVDRTNGAVQRVSVGAGGAQADFYSDYPALSRDGRYAMFMSDATNLVAGDDNGATDVFVRDRQLGTTRRVSVGTGAAGLQANAGTDWARIDADGTRVCFTTAASNLAAGDANESRDVFVRDLVQSTTTLVTRNAAGAPGNGSSLTCAFAATSGTIVFESSASDLTSGDTNASLDVFVANAQGIVRLDTGPSGAQANGHSYEPTISADGRYVAFTSLALNLPGDHAGGRPSTYLYDRTLRTTTRLSLTTAGLAPAANSSFAEVSPSGTYVVYNADSDDQVAGDRNREPDLVLFRAAGGTRELVARAPVPLPSGGGGYEPALSADGRYAVFTSESPLLAPDANGVAQIYVYDRNDRSLTLVSRNLSGQPAARRASDPQISADGRYIAFLSDAKDLVAAPYYQFTSHNAYIYDRTLGTLQRVTNDPTGSSATGSTFGLAMSADGGRVAICTSATNLVPSDVQTNGPRIYVWTRATNAWVRADSASGGTPASFQVDELGSLSADGRYVTFESRATNLVANDTNGHADVFRKDLATGATTLISRGAGGVPANGGSGEGSISADGRYVAYRSEGSNVVEGDTNGGSDVFRFDASTGTTTRVTAGYTGPAATHTQPRISADGRYVAFVTDAAHDVADRNGRLDVYVHDTRRGGRAVRASVGADGREHGAEFTVPAFSGDGFWLTFAVYASVVPVAGRENAAVDHDVLVAINAHADGLHSDGFETAP